MMADDVRVPGIEQMDLAKVAPCLTCGTPTRFMGSVPISGTGLDLHFAYAVHCAACRKAKVDEAAAGIVCAPGRKVVL